MFPSACLGGGWHVGDGVDMPVEDQEFLPWNLGGTSITWEAPVY